MNQAQQDEINLNYDEIQKHLEAAQNIIKKIQRLQELHRPEHNLTKATQKFPGEKK
jgi:hypothetical protein